MASLLSLPPELLSLICSWVDGHTRSNTLSSFSLTAKAFRYPAQDALLVQPDIKQSEQNVAKLLRTAIEAQGALEKLSTANKLSVLIHLKRNPRRNAPFLSAHVMQELINKVQAHQHYTQEWERTIRAEVPEALIGLLLTLLPRLKTLHLGAERFFYPRVRDYAIPVEDLFGRPSYTGGMVNLPSIESVSTPGCISTIAFVLPNVRRITLGKSEVVDSRVCLSLQAYNNIKQLTHLTIVVRLRELAILSGEFPGSQWRTSYIMAKLRRHAVLEELHFHIQETELMTSEDGVDFNVLWDYYRPHEGRVKKVTVSFDENVRRGRLNSHTINRLRLGSVSPIDFFEIPQAVFTERINLTDVDFNMFSRWTTEYEEYECKHVKEVHIVEATARIDRVAMDIVRGGWVSLQRLGISFINDIELSKSDDAAWVDVIARGIHVTRQIQVMDG